MPENRNGLLDRLTRIPPFDLLPEDIGQGLVAEISRIEAAHGDILFREGDRLKGLYIVESGTVDIESSHADLVSQRGPGDIMGERGLLRNGNALLTARATSPAELLLIPSHRFHDLIRKVPDFAAWFGRSSPQTDAEPDSPYATGLTALHVGDLMSTPPVTCTTDDTAADVARLMRDRTISSVLVMRDDKMAGIVTVHDLTNKVLAEGLNGSVPVRDVMTPDPIRISPESLGLDALLTLSDHGINHLPVEAAGRIVGVIAKTDLVRQQATTASHMIADIAQATTAVEMSGVMARVPHLLTQLVSAGARHTAITRRITDITDAITRRLLTLAEDRFGPPPVPYLWLACGSQGRREQTGVSDQDNCLILDDAMATEHDDYFARLAKFVCDGLNTCGFVYCPGDMMATTPKWRQPRRVWRDYFAGWISEPDNMAQMLASVMFDLRPIAGEAALFDKLQDDVLSMARANSIFVAHMISNALKHTPPLSLFRGFALIRSGEHKNMLDLKHSGVVPVVDLGRVYALEGGFDAVNTRKRLEAARDSGVISKSGALDLLDAYDLIAETRLRHQAARIRAGENPDNFMAPGTLSELERSHLRDAFMVVKTMQSAVGHGKGGLG